MMLLVCAFGCMDSIEYLPKEMYELLATGKETIVLEADTDAFTASEYAKKYAGQEIMICAAELTENAGTTESGSLTVIGEGNLIHFLDENNCEFFMKKSDVMLSRKMSELLSVGVGDIVQLRILGDDEIKKLRITKIYRDPNVQGMTISKALFEEMEYDFVPQKILSNYILSEEILEEAAVKAIYHSSQQWKDMLASMKVMNMMVTIFVTAAVLLGLVVLYNLSELSFVEKMREYATLKALGMENRIIKRIIDVQNFIVGGIGILFGIPAGNYMLSLMWKSMSDSSDMRAIVTVRSYLTAGIITLVVVEISCLLMAFRMKKINMIDALKGVE